MQQQIPSHAASGTLCLELLSWTVLALAFWFARFRLHIFVFGAVSCGTFVWEEHCCTQCLGHLVATVFVVGVTFGAQASALRLWSFNTPTLQELDWTRA